MFDKQEAIVENMIRTFERLSQNSPYVKFSRDAAFIGSESELPLTIFNRVFDFRATHDERIDVNRQIASIIDSYRERGVRFIWHTYAHRQNEAVIEALTANGLSWQGTMSGMAVELRNRDIEPSRIPGLRIVTVRTDDELQAFRRVFAAEYGLPDDLSHAFTEAFAYDPEGIMRYYLAYRNDTPVGTAMTHSTEDVTGVYMVATLKEFRKQGIGSALVGHVLNDIQAAGAKLAVLQASPMGRNLYARHGFAEEMTIQLYASV